MGLARWTETILYDGVVAGAASIMHVHVRAITSVDWIWATRTTQRKRKVFDYNLNAVVPGVDWSEEGPERGKLNIPAHSRSGAEFVTTSIARRLVCSRANKKGPDRQASPFLTPTPKEYEVGRQSLYCRPNRAN
jgi:hypothetical protein